MNSFSFKKLKEEISKQITPSSLKKHFISLSKEVRKKDLIIFSLFPLFITLLMLLPQTLRGFLQLNIKNPIWWQYLTQSFIHNGWNHLSSNLGGYLVYSIFLILIVSYTRLKKEFYKLFLFLLISLPIISSLIQVKFYPVLLSWLPNLQNSSGSSGIVSALAGFSIIFWAVYFSKINDKIIFDVRTPLFFAIYIAFLFVFFYGQGTRIVFILMLLLLLGFLFTLITNFKFIFLEISKETKDNLILAFILITLPLLFIVTPKIIFPSFENMFNGGSFTDFLMHYIGIAYGVIIAGSYFIFINKKWRQNV